MTKDIEQFAAYLKTADTLLKQATKEEVADVARVLVFHLGHYRTRFGDLPTTASLDQLTVENITDEMAVPLASGLEALIEVLKAMGAPEGGTSSFTLTRHDKGWRFRSNIQ